MTQPAKPYLSPDLDELAAQFYAECAKGRLCFQRCCACATWRHLPRYGCGACGSTAWEWAPSSGRGRVFSWTVTHQAPFPQIPTPYAVAVIETEEGVRLAAGLRGIPLDSIELDLQVEVELVPVHESAAVPFFHPTK